MARLRDSWCISLSVDQQPRNPQSESIARTPYQFRLDHAGFRSRDRASSSYRVLPNPISNIMQEATVLDGIGFTVPDSGESRLGRVPAQPARLKFSRKSSAPEGAVINRWPASGARTMAARLGPPRAMSQSLT